MPKAASTPTNAPEWPKIAHATGINSGKPKIFGVPLSSNCTGAAMIAMEAGVGGLEAVDIMSGAHKQEPFLAINPYGQVPALEDGDVKLGESHVRSPTRHPIIHPCIALHHF